MTNGLKGAMNLKSDLNDSELLRLMLAGDEEALALLYRRRQGAIYRFALQMSGSKDDRRGRHAGSLSVPNAGRAFV